MRLRYQLGTVSIVGILVIGIYLSATQPRFLSPSLPATSSSSEAVNESVDSQGSVPNSGCLSSDEVANYIVNKNSHGTSTATIFVSRKSDGTKVASFDIMLPIPDHYHPIELHNCHAYADYALGYDYQRHQILPNYSFELWEYDYNGKGQEVMELENASSVGSSLSFDSDFRVDNSETYVALKRGYENSANNALVIESLKTPENRFILQVSNITKQAPWLLGDFVFSPGGWTDDSRYFWFNFHNAAVTLGFVRIDSKNWSYQAFQAPTTTMGGDAFDLNTSMTTYETNVAPWTGSSDMNQQLRDQAARAGQISSLRIRNLLTGQDYLVATTTDPTYYFQPKWISSMVLQYMPPSGATSTYKVQ